MIWRNGGPQWLELYIETIKKAGYSIIDIQKMKKGMLC
jgi:hypothetical protein